MYDGVMDDGWPDWDDWEMDEQPRSHIRLRKQYALPGQHIPNKNEGKLLRKLMAETGLSEKELRNHKKYRVMLSNAQKAQGKKTPRDRFLNQIMKGVTRDLKLAKEHPKVQEEFKKRLEEKVSRLSHYSKRKYGF